MLQSATALTAHAVDLFPLVGDQTLHGVVEIAPGVTTGIEGGNLYIPSGAVLHLGACSVFVLNPGYSIFMTGGKIILDPGASIRKGYLCVDWAPEDSCWRDVTFSSTASCCGGTRWEDVPPGMPKCTTTLYARLHVFGPFTGESLSALRFSARGASCGRGTSVEYRFEWGDGAFSDWLPAHLLEPLAFGTDSHEFPASPITTIYTVRAQARCASDSADSSDWSRGHEVTVLPSPEAPNEYSVDSPLLGRADVTAEQLNSFFLNRGTVYYDEKPHRAEDSPLASLGEAWIAAANETDINPIYLAAHAIVESGWGFSPIAQSKYNIYGYRAFDIAPYREAEAFDSYADCVTRCSAWISRDYLSPNGTYFSERNGATLRGMNENYATDVRWGETIADVMTQIVRYVLAQ